MYIYKYIIFKTISVFQRQVLRVFFPLFLTFSIFKSFFFPSKSNLKRTDDISNSNGAYLKEKETDRCYFQKKRKDGRHGDRTFCCGNGDTSNLRLNQFSTTADRKKRLSAERRI